MGFFSSIKDKIQGKVPSGAKRSAAWPKVRAEFLKNHAACAVCESTQNLEVHHCRPFHLHPELELDPHNFVALCESDEGGVNCHLHFGHLGSFKSFNVAVKDDVASWHAKIKNRPLHDVEQEEPKRKAGTTKVKAIALHDDRQKKTKSKVGSAKIPKKKTA